MKHSHGRFKWQRRDRKLHRRRHGMRMDGASIRRIQMDLAERRRNDERRREGKA